MTGERNDDRPHGAGAVPPANRERDAQGGRDAGRSADASEPREGFFGRWSRRKRHGERPDEARPAARTAVAAEPAEAAAGVVPATSMSVPATRADALPRGADDATIGAAAVADATVDPPAAAPQSEDRASDPPPTLDDVRALTVTSDFRRFMTRDVPSDVRNAALKTLLADPHYNVMDGLDTYIDDYHHHEPLPRAQLRLMRQAREMGLLDDELVEQPASAAAAATMDGTEPDGAAHAAGPSQSASDASDAPDARFRDIDSDTSADDVDAVDAADTVVRSDVSDGSGDDDDAGAARAARGRADAPGDTDDRDGNAAHRDGDPDRPRTD